MSIKAAVVVVVALLLGARSVVADHAFSAEFDSDKPVKLTGLVTKLDWTNPHAWIYVDVKDEASLKSGDEVTVEGSRAKNGATVANSSS